MSNTGLFPNPSHQILTYNLLGVNKKDRRSTLPQILLFYLMFTSDDPGTIVEGNLCHYLNDQSDFNTS